MKAKTSSSKDVEAGGSQRGEKEVNLLGWQLRLPVSFLAFILCLGVFGFSILAAFFSESVFRTVPDLSISWLLTPFELGVSTLLASRQGFFVPTSAPRGDLLRRYCLLGLYYVSARFLTNYIVDIADYPTQVVVKSAKIIPVMLVGVVAFRKRYSLIEYVCAVAMVFGLVAFTFANISAKPTDASSSPASELTHIVALVLGGLALACDGLVSNTQESLLEGETSESQAIFYMNSVAFVVCTIAGTVTGHIPRVIGALWELESGGRVVALMIATGVTSFFSVTFIVSLLRLSGAVICVMITSCRKVVTVLISFLVFPKPLNMHHVLGAGLVFTALFIEVYIKYKR